jgi:hypothetical protein
MIHPPQNEQYFEQPAQGGLPKMGEVYDLNQLMGGEFNSMTPTV